MTKKEFVEQNKIKAEIFLANEARDMGCRTKKEVDNYIKDCMGFIFVGTKKEVEDEFYGDDEYFIIAQDSDWMMIEGFNGLTYDGTEYGIA